MKHFGQMTVQRYLIISLYTALAVFMPALSPTQGLGFHGIEYKKANDTDFGTAFKNL